MFSCKETQHHLPGGVTGGSSVQGCKQDWPLKLDQDAELGRGKAKEVSKNESIIHKPRIPGSSQFPLLPLEFVLSASPLVVLRVFGFFFIFMFTKKREVVIISLTAFPPIS